MRCCGCLHCFGPVKVVGSGADDVLVSLKIKTCLSPEKAFFEAPKT